MCANVRAALVEPCVCSRPAGMYAAAPGARRVRETLTMREPDLLYVTRLPEPAVATRTCGPVWLCSFVRAPA